jgi:hypothetical protein
MGVNYFGLVWAEVWRREMERRANSGDEDTSWNGRRYQQVGRSGCDETRVGSTCLCKRMWD